MGDREGETAVVWTGLVDDLGALVTDGGRGWICLVVIGG
jgi:hypothetical protein